MLRSVLVLVAMSTAAHAGYCLSEEEREEETKKLELFARSPDTLDDNEVPMLECVTRGSADARPKTAQAYEKRALAACTKIAAMRDRKDRMAGALISSCGDFAVAHGVTTAGKVDLVAKILARPADWFQDPGFEALAGSGDARARPFVVDKLTAALAKVGAKKMLGWRRDAWRDYRLAALHALAKVGTKDDVALVDKVIATAGKERKVLEAAKVTRDALH